MWKCIFKALVVGVVLMVAMAALAVEVKPTDEVARVDTFIITVADLQKKLLAISPDRPEKNLEARRREALDSLIAGRLLDLRSRSIRLEEDTAFVRQADYLLSQILSRELFNQAVVLAVAVTDSELVNFYRTRQDDFLIPERLRARHILIFPTKDTVNALTSRQKETGWWAKNESEALAISDSLHRIIQNGAAFDSLARHWSQDQTSALQGGDLGLFRRGEMVPEFDSVVFNLHPGDVSAPFKTQFGYHIAKLLDRQAAHTAALSDSLNGVIREQIRREKITARTYAFIDSMQQAAGLVFNDRFLRWLDTLSSFPGSIPAGEPKWAVASSWGDTVWSELVLGQLKQARQASPKPVSPEQLMEIIKGLINPFIMRRAVADLRIAEGEVYRQKKEQIYHGERLARLRKNSLKEYTPSEEEVRQYFENHRFEFPRKDTLSVRVQQIVLKTQREADLAYRDVMGHADFFEVAKAFYSGDSEMLRESFNLGFLSPPAMPKSFFDVAETLTVNTVSRPVKTEWGYHLIRVLERRPDLAFAFARPEITNRLRQAKQEEHKRKWEEELSSGRQIKINERLLKKIKDPALEKLSSDGGN